MTTHGPSSLDAHLGYWMRMVSNAVSRSFARQVEAEGVTVAEWVFLRVLLDTGPIAPSRLAARMAMTRGAVSKLADRLVGKTLVTRAGDPGDGRAQRLALAPGASAMVGRLAALADDNDEAFFGVLTPQERARLGQVLRKLVAEHRLGDMPTD